MRYLSPEITIGSYKDGCLIVEQKFTREKKHIKHDALPPYKNQEDLYLDCNWDESAVRVASTRAPDYKTCVIGPLFTHIVNNLPALADIPTPAKTQTRLTKKTRESSPMSSPFATSTVKIDEVGVP